ncbi:MAG: SHOCT domain-containing protein [bacterium]|nr:SHOCT domain-containing protein [bacterium]
MMGYYNDYIGGFGLFGPLFMIIFWGLIIWVIVALVRGSGHSGGCCRSGDSGDKALDILKERYAKGEIKKEEYEQKKKDLS